MDWMLHKTGLFSKVFVFLSFFSFTRQTILPRSCLSPSNICCLCVYFIIMMKPVKSMDAVRIYIPCLTTWGYAEIYTKNFYFATGGLRKCKIHFSSFTRWKPVLTSAHFQTQQGQKKCSKIKEHQDADRGDAICAINYIWGWVGEIQLLLNNLPWICLVKI